MTDMTIEEVIISALRGDPKTLAELAEILRMNRFVLWGCHLKFLVEAEMVVKLPCGRYSLPEEAESDGRRA